MKIEKVIFTIDDNPHYKAFWLSISRHFKTKMEMTPKLFIIGDNVDTNGYSTEFGEIEVVPKVPNVPTIIQALIGKFYFTKTELETTWLIGDLDLYPLQRYHFTEMIKDISDDGYVHLHPHAYGKNWRNSVNGLAGYFHIAKGKTFMEELKFERPFEDVVNEIFNSNSYGIKFHGQLASQVSMDASSDYGWFCCEEMYTGVKLRDCQKLTEIPPTNGYSRVDRSTMVYNINDIKKGKYIDFHAPRPYEKYSNVIETIINEIGQ
jgi:hypothetical protein